jgi:S1-C subfamily serine protease
MHYPRLPDWLIYLAVVLGLILAALSRQERADAPPAPPPVPGVASIPLGPGSPFLTGRVVAVPNLEGPGTGTAFSVSEHGVWITARHVVEGCGQVAVVVAEGRGVVARVISSPDNDVALLVTEGGSTPLPILDPSVLDSLKRGMRGYHPGFPQGTPGEVASRYLGRNRLVIGGRGGKPEPVLVWAEVGRTSGLKGPLAGLSGAPVLDATGRVIGVTVAEAPRRGRIYTSDPSAIFELLAKARRQEGRYAPGEAINTENYGRAADALRRDLRVAQVVCVA